MNDLKMKLCQLWMNLKSVFYMKNAGLFLEKLMINFNIKFIIYLYILYML